MVKDISTEAAILTAARKVFIRKGMTGARMQEIADEAGINKALLHYYFRNKEKLFEAVFKEAFGKLMPQIVMIMSSDVSLFDKIRSFTSQYIDTIIENPYLPSFILHELQRDPDRLFELLDPPVENVSLLNEQINVEVKKGIIKPITADQLMINMLGLCIFPFIAKPILVKMFYEGNMEKFTEMLETRKKSVAEFIINAIKK